MSGGLVDGRGRSGAMKRGKGEDGDAERAGRREGGRVEQVTREKVIRYLPSPPTPPQYIAY